MLTGLLAKRWCKSPKSFAYDKFAERKPGFDIESRTADLAWLYTPYYHLCTTQGIKATLENKVVGHAHQAWSPHIVLSCFLFSPFLLCSSFRMNDWSMGALWDDLLAWASKTHLRRCLRWRTFSDSRERLWPLWSEQVWCHKLLVSHINQSGQASVSPLCYPFRQRRPPEGIPGSNRGWTPVVRWSHSVTWIWL